MLTTFEALPPRPQEPLADVPFDRWVNPVGSVSAEFRRIPEGYFARFPGQADFSISLEAMHVRGTPVDGTPLTVLESLYHNSIEPIIANHLGGLNLHGSAVATPHGAIAFLGQSRSGKTTLAGAFARAGHAFLTEDVLTLTDTGDGYLVQPQRAVLRLFHDSAQFLLGSQPGWEDEELKQELAAGDRLPFASEPAPLIAIFLLGPDESDDVSLVPLGAAEALSQLIPHSFVLDVEDRQRLAAHFGRLGELASRVPCHSLDYPRCYAQLPEVIGAVLERVKLDG